MDTIDYSVFQRVNWNATDGKGKYPCRKNNCYSLNVVIHTIASYLKAIKQGVEIYNPEKQTETAKAQTVKSVSLIAHGESVTGKEGIIEAILFEHYWLLKEKGITLSSGSVNWGLATIGAATLGVIYWWIMK